MRKAPLPATRSTRKEKGSPPQPESSRERLLAVATELFGRRGVDGTSIRELAEAAGANVAAVHYHFGGKEELYAAVIERAFQRMEEHRASLERALATARAEGTPQAAERSLATCIDEFLKRLFDGAEPSWAATFLSRESVQPTKAMGRVIREFVRPTWDTFLSLLDLLRPDLAGTQATRFVASSIVGQCLYYQQALPVVLSTFELRRIDEDFLDKAAAHIVRFSLDALRRR
jgi:AcrR family transcriptional regulator